MNVPIKNYRVTLRQKDGKEEDVLVESYSAEDAVYQTKIAIPSAVVVAIYPHDYGAMPQYPCDSAPLYAPEHYL